MKLTNTVVTQRAVAEKDMRVYLVEASLTQGAVPMPLYESLQPAIFALASDAELCAARKRTNGLTVNVREIKVL